MLNGISRRATMAMTQTKMTRLKMERKLDFPPFLLPPKPRRNCFSWLAVTIKLSFLLSCSRRWSESQQNCTFCASVKGEMCGQNCKTYPTTVKTIPQIWFDEPKSGETAVSACSLNTHILKRAKTSRKFISCSPPSHPAAPTLIYFVVVVWKSAIAAEFLSIQHFLTDSKLPNSFD